MLKVLWLCSWYPNSLSPFDGDFVQRHAQAASKLNRIDIVKLTPDPDAKAVSKVTRTFQQWPHLTETFVYYPKPHSLIGKTISYFRWYSLYKYTVETYIEKNGKPDLVHVHIPFKSGVIARLIKRKYNIPYIITEHWGGYNNVIENNYRQRESWFKKIIKDTFKDASAVHSVSHYLATQIADLTGKAPVTIFRNAVNEKYFNYHPVVSAEGKFRLVHVSNGAPVKNIPGILKAFDSLDNDQYTCIVIGLPAEQNELYQKLHPAINFTGEIEYREVAHHLQQADALIIFSHIENSPCVIGEALCCGVPVVATNVGGIPELVDESNGILIDAGDVGQLISAIKGLCENIHQYSREEIAAKAQEKFSYEQISSETDLLYKNTLKAIGNLL